MRKEGRDTSGEDGEKESMLFADLKATDTSEGWGETMQYGWLMGVFIILVHWVSTPPGEFMCPPGRLQLRVLSTS